jgi:hypothetical protein
MNYAIYNNTIKNNETIMENLTREEIIDFINNLHTLILSSIHKQLYDKLPETLINIEYNDNYNIDNE